MVESYVGGFGTIEILDESLNYYANLMIDDFRKSEIYKKYYAEATNLNCKIKTDCGKSIDLKDKDIYLGIAFCDENDKTLEIYDEGEMSASISIVRVDAQNKYYFSHWLQDDFVDDINWLLNKMRELENEIKF